LRVCSGFLAGILLGFLLGTLSHYVKALHPLISPLMAVIRATPVASFILLVLFWMTTDRVPTFISLLMVLPIVWQNTLLGYEKKDGGLDEMAKVFRIPALKIFLKIDFPQVLSYTLSAGKTALGLAWKAGIAAEAIALPAVSIGRQLMESKIYLETTDLFAWTSVVIVLSLILETAATRLFRLWQTTGDRDRTHGKEAAV
jgi:NitT/TauT family transport system permease protein